MLNVFLSKTKTKVITLANQKGHTESNEPIKTRNKKCSWCEARKNEYKRVALGLVLHMIG